MVMVINRQLAIAFSLFYHEVKQRSISIDAHRALLHEIVLTLSFHLSHCETSSSEECNWGHSAHVD